MRKKIIEENIRRTLETCFVCSKKITGEPVRLPSSKLHPDGLHRHQRCEPGSLRWLRSDVGKNSDNRDLFPELKEEKEEQCI